MPIKYTDKYLIKITKQYNYIKDFKKYYPNEINAIYNRGLSKLCFSHMKRCFNSYTNKELLTIAKKYKKRTDFKKNDNKIYTALQRRGLLPFACKHMPIIIKKLSNNELKNISLKYKTRKEFYTKNRNAYQTVLKRKLQNKYFKHMIWVSKRRTHKSAIVEAKQYKTFSELHKCNPNLASYLYKNEKTLNKVKSLLEITGSKYHRFLYIYYFNNKKVYIGITYNLELRHKQHLKILLKNVKKYKRLFWGPFKVERAVMLEKRYIKNYRENGYIVLNRAVGGAVGGTSLKYNYTDDEIIERAKNYKTRIDLRKADNWLYTQILKRKLNKKAFSHMVSGRGKYSFTYEIIQMIAKRYPTRKKFAKAHYSAYYYARKNKILEQVCSHMPVPPKSSRWC